MTIILSIIGLVLSVQAKKEMPVGTAGMVTAGMGCSIVALVLSSIMFISCVLCVGVIGLAGAY